MIKKILGVNDVKKKIVLFVIYFSLIGIMYIFELPCFYISFFGIPCPGCGMTRAIIAFLSFDLAGAFSHHFMFWSLPVLYLYFWFDGHIFKKKNVDKIIISSILVGFGINWVINLFNTVAF